MVWPIIIFIVIIIAIAAYLYRKDHGSRAYPLNRFCLGCQKRYADNLSTCPYCGESYFNFNQK